MSVYGPVIQANTQLLADVRTNFMGAYDLDIGKSGILNTVQESIQEIQMERRQDRFFYYGTVPLAEHIPYGQEVGFENVITQSWIINAFKYGKALAWSRDDAMDDLTKSIPQQARKLGEALKYLPVRIFFQMIQGIADLKLLGPAANIPDAPDGAALYSATDGAGAARFGATGGNLVTQTGVTASAITTDFFTMISQAASFLHTDGDTPLLAQGQLQNIIIYYPPELIRPFSEAFVRTYVANSSSVFEGTNVIREGGYTIKLEPTSYLRDATDWYAFFPDVEQSVVRGIREDLVTAEFDCMAHPNLATKFISFFMAFQREGWSPNLPFGTLKVA